MIDDFAKAYLHSDLRAIRQVILDKLDGLGEYAIRRPLTATGTNLLGLVKHLSLWESRYFGEVFGRPFPEPLPRWDDAAARGADMWVTEHETHEEIVDRYRRVWEHSDTTITALAIDAPGHVPWWPSPHVTLFNVLVHMLTETSRHAGHADILREQLDGSTGTAAGPANRQRDTTFWHARRAEIERAATAADPANAHQAVESSQTSAIDVPRKEHRSLMSNERLQAVAQLWEAHMQAPFPARLRGAEIAGVDMVLLDADTAGCVKTWLDSNGRLDAWRRETIASCLDELNRVMPHLADQDEAAYYNRLRELAMLLHSDHSTPTQQ